MDWATSMTMATVSNPTATINSSSMTAMPSMPSMSAMPGMEGMDMSCKISMLWNWYTIDACFLASGWHIKSGGMFAGSCIGVIGLVLCLELLRRLGREYDAFILRRARLRRTYLSSSFSGLSTVIRKAQGQNYSDIPPTSKKPNGDPYSINTPSSDDLITALPESNSVRRAADQNLADSTDTNTATKGILPKNAMGTSDFNSYRPSPVEQVIRALLHVLQFAVAYFIMLLAMYFNGYIIICIFVGAFLGSLIFSWEPVSMMKENDATQVTKCCG